MATVESVDYASGTRVSVGRAAGQEAFFDFPVPSDLRLVGGRPDLTAYPNPNDLTLVSGQVENAVERRGVVQQPVV